jgi:hypothetical protein
MDDEIVVVVTPEGPGPMNIATISAGFEKGDFLVREEQGNRVYFDFFEEVGWLLVVQTMMLFMMSVRIGSVFVTMI